jgi:hypothetical protein
MALYNLARMTTATVGTGATLTLGGAVPGFLPFALAGVANGVTVSYGIVDGTQSECGTGVYTSSGTTLTRNVTKSTNADARINLSGNAQVSITARAEDLCGWHRQRLQCSRQPSTTWRSGRSDYDQGRAACNVAQHACFLWHCVGAEYGGGDGFNFLGNAGQGLIVAEAGL